MSQVLKIWRNVHMARNCSQHKPANDKITESHEHMSNEVGGQHTGSWSHMSMGSWEQMTMGSTGLWEDMNMGRYRIMGVLENGSMGLWEHMGMGVWDHGST